MGRRKGVDTYIPAVHDDDDEQPHEEKQVQQQHEESTGLAASHPEGPHSRRECGHLRGRQGGRQAPHGITIRRHRRLREVRAYKMGAKRSR